MSELRLYARRDSLQDGAGCAWALIDDAGQVERSGTDLDAVPAARYCRLVLAADRVLTLTVDLPDLPARKLAPMLAAAAESATLDDAENLHVVMLGERAGPARRLAVIDKNWLARLLAQLHGHGLHPDSALPESLLLPWQADVAAVLVHEDGVVARLGEFDGAALDQGEPPMGLRLALQQAGAPTRIGLMRGSVLNPPDPARWQAELNRPVDDAGPWDWRTAPWNDSINLLTAEFAPARGRRDWRALVRPLAYGAALLAVLHLTGLTLHWAMQSREQTRIRAEMRAIAAQALPAHAAVVDPAWQVGEQLRGLAAASGAGGPDSLMALSARLGQAWPAANGVIPRSLDYATGTGIEISLDKVDAGWLEQLKSAGAALDLAISSEAGADQRTVVRVRGSNAGGAQ